MPGNTMISSLKSTIDALKLAAAKTKQTKAIEDALEQLDSTPKLLELSNLSGDTFTRLCSLLRDRLLPLYDAFPALTLQHSVSILTIIYEEKISIAVVNDNDQLRGSWETVQTALLSGILDFVEEHATSGNRANVATALYPILRAVFFSSSSLPRFGGGLSYTLYQLLSETVTAQPVNQRKLRSPEFLGGKQIGMILSHSKDFLAIEALLELFAKLLPSTKSKGGLEKRSAFIHEVFDPATIAGSEQVVHVLKTISVTDWETTFLKILDILAGADVSYPQPFETSKFRTHGLPTCTVERLYVDHHGFLANLDQCGELETLQISFAIVDGVKLAAPSAFKTSITVRLSSPPFVGRAVLVPLSERDIFLSFDIDNRDVARFLESLVERGLKDIIHQTERKLSKAKAHLEFDFQKSGSKRTPISTQDKVQNLARLWDTNASSSRHGDAMPTSPLLQGPAPQISSLRHKDNFGTADESDLSADEDDLPRQLLSTHIQCHGKAAAPISLDSDDEAGIMTRPRPRKNRPNIVLSEDEVVKIDQLSIKSNKAPKLAPRRIQEDALSVEEPSTEVLDYCKSSSNELALVSCGSGPELPYEKTNTVRDNDVPTKSQSAHQVIPPISSTGPLATDPSKMAEPMTSEVKNHISTMIGLKRAASQDPIEDPTESGINHHPSKRFCRSTTEVITSSYAARQPPTSKRYGRKGRTSSPTRSTTDEVDFDELPALLTESNIKKPKPRNSAMKGRAGKNIPSEKSGVGKLKAEQGRATMQPALTQDVNKKSALIEPKSPKSPEKLSGNVKLKQTIKQEGQVIHDIKPTRRSARVANIQADFKETQSWTSARGKHSASDELIPINDRFPQKKSTRQETKTKPFISSVNPPSPPTPVGVKEISPDLVTDVSTIKPAASTSTIIKEPSMPSEPSKENDVVTIDLTQNTPKTSPKAASPKNKIPVTTIATRSSPPDSERSTRLSRLILPSSTADSPCVSFASPLHHQNRVSRQSRGLGNDDHPLSKKIDASAFPADYENARNYAPNFRTYNFSKETMSREDPILRIVDVIKQLTEVIVQNASRRFDNVRTDLCVGRNSILFGTADDLEKMHAASVDCFNALVDLEEEYADHRRNVIDGFGDLSKTTHEICRYLAETIQESNRNSLSRKFSNAFFTLPLPVIISNPKLML